MGNHTLIRRTTTTAGLVAILLQPHSAAVVAAVNTAVTTSSPTAAVNNLSSSVNETDLPGTTRMAIETPLSGATLASAFLAAGYAFDPAATSGSGVDAVVLYAYHNFGSGEAPAFLGAATYGTAREDVARAYGSTFTNCGFQLNVSGLPT